MMVAFRLTTFAQIGALFDRNPSTLAPASAEAHRLAALGTTMTIIATVVFVLVLGLLFFGMRRAAARRDDDDAAAPPISENRWVIGGGLVFPAVVLIGVFVLTLSTLRADVATRDFDPATADVEVIGHQWWWEIRYPHDGVVTANELHLPVDSSMRVVLRSADVIHSFWIPTLAGKTDVIPGQTNRMRITGDSAGVFRGTCAEYCGVQHANMAVAVVVEPRAEFARWIEGQQKEAPAADDPAIAAGRDAFLHESCAFCHTIRGTPAAGAVGPDLTHFGSRLTLAAGTAPNASGPLAAWILDPAALKPGTKMPPIALDGATLQAIVLYLSSLK